MKSTNRVINRRRLQFAAAALLTASCGFSALADFSSAVLAKSPKGYWKLDETNLVPVMAVATNYGSAGAAANGTYLNGATSVPTPIAGAAGQSAVRFDGVSQKIQLPYNASLNPSSAFSVEAWVRPSTSNGWDNTWYRAVLRSGGQNWGGGYMLQYNANSGNDAGVFKFALYNSSGGFEVYNTNYMSSPNFTIFATNDVWFHMVGTWSSADNQGHLYVNGIELTNMNPATTGGIAYTPTTNSFLRIGADDTSPTDPVGNHLNPGATAHVAVYDTQLTPSQILAHYQAGTNAAANYSATVQADNPVAYWKLNETSFPAQPAAVNLGTAGASLNGTYCFASTPGLPGGLPPNYGGMTATNKGVYLTNTVTGIGDGGYVLFPPLRAKTDNTNLTIVAIIKNKGAQMASTAILGRRMVGSQKAGFQFDSSGLGLGYNWDDTSSQYNFSSGLKPLDGVWTFVALVITPTNAVVYMDSGSGLQAATNNVANLVQDGFAYQNYLGAEGGNYANSGRRYNGTIDELAVWGSSLTTQDMLDLREAWIGSGLFIASQPVSRPVMLGGMAKFNCTPAGSTNYMPFTYRLKKDGVPVGPVSSSATLFYTNVQPADLGSVFTVDVLTNGVSGGLSSAPVGLQRWTLPGTYSEVVESYHPTAYYRFTEASGTVYELAQCLDGTTNGLISKTAGPAATNGVDVGFEASNSAYNMNAAGGSPPAGGYVNCGGAGIVFNNGSIVTTTISGWIYPTASQTAYSGIYYCRNNDYAGLTFGPSGGYELGVSWNGNYNTHTYVYVYPNTWNFFAMVVTNDAATFYSYANGFGWQSNTISGPFPVRNLTGGTGTAIGTDPNTSLNRGIKGYLDELAVFNRFMTWDDVQALVSADANVHVSISKSAGNNNTIGWSWGTLRWADSLNGPWTDVPGASAPSFTTNSVSPQKYFRAVY
jgi:hypothetical protein